MWITAAGRLVLINMVLYTSDGSAIILGRSGISTVNIYPKSLFPYTLLQSSPLNSRRNSCKLLAELLTRENMSFTGECLCVITKAHPELTEPFVGAADLCKDAAHRFHNNAKVSKIWYGSNAIIIRTNKRLAVCGA